MVSRRFILALLALTLGVLPLAAARAEDPFIVLASTTSTENSGLLRYLVPLFKAKTGIDVRVVAVGTGAALKLGEKGDADVVLVHARAAEDKFMAAGFGSLRRDVMYNDFVIVGPAADPAGIKGKTDVAAALAEIADKQATFISRGDDSGTHKAERRLWQAAAIDPTKSTGHWYLETGSGMGATLNQAAARDAYTLSDRGTWLSFKNRRELEILLAGDPRMFNPYGVMLVNPSRYPHVKAKEGMAFIDWLTSPEGQRLIGEFKINGQRLFIPSYKGS